MPLLPLLPLKFWREGAIGALMILVTVSVSQCHRRSTEVSKLKLAYLNPAIKEVIKTIRVAGPVQIRTVIVERPSGEKETTIDETHAEVRETNDESSESAPVPVNIVLPTVRQNRWLLTFGVNRLSKDFDGKAFLAGYGWANRIDIQVGAIRKDDDTSPWLLTTFRF